MVVTGGIGREIAVDPSAIYCLSLGEKLALLPEPSIRVKFEQPDVATITRTATTDADRGEIALRNDTFMANLLNLTTWAGVDRSLIPLSKWRNRNICNAVIKSLLS